MNFKDIFLNNNFYYHYKYYKHFSVPSYTLYDMEFGMEKWHNYSIVSNHSYTTLPCGPSYIAVVIIVFINKYLKCKFLIF